MPDFYSLSDEEDAQSQPQRNNAGSSSNDTTSSRDRASSSRNRPQSNDAEDDDSWMNDDTLEQKRAKIRARLGLGNGSGSGSGSRNGRTAGQDFGSGSNDNSSSGDRFRSGNDDSRNIASNLNAFGFGMGPAVVPDMNFDEDLPHGEDEAEISKLGRAWANERASPELLYWMEDIVDSVVEQIGQQVVSDLCFEDGR